MKKIFQTLLILALGAQYGMAQKVIKEATFDPSGKAKITNLSEVKIDKENNQMSLFYLTKSTGKKIKAEVLYFDFDFNFIKSENMEEDVDKVREKYKLTFSLNFCPEDKHPLLAVEANMMTGQTVFKKGYIENYFNWTTGMCDDKFKVEDKVKPKGDSGESIKLAYYWSSNEIQKYFRTTSVKRYSYTKGTTITSSTLANKDVVDATNGDVVILGLVYDKKNTENGKNYTVQKFSIASLEKSSEKALKFDAVAIPIFMQYLSSGNIAFVFHRMDNKLEYVELTFNGDVARRYVVESPTDKVWHIDEMTEVSNGEVIFTGRITKEKGKDLAGLVYLPATTKAHIEGYLGYKTLGYQVMKVGKNKIDNITYNSVADFATTFKVIEGDKKSKPFAGDYLTNRDVHETKTGELMVTAQKVNSGKMTEIVMFYFDKSGKLIANYSTPITKKNKYNQVSPAIQSAMNSPKTNDTYWTLYEVAGVKESFDGKNNRTLYSPRIARVSADGQKVSSFVSIGDKYYLDDKFPVNELDANTFIFIGADKSGKTMWFSKVYFE